MFRRPAPEHAETLAAWLSFGIERVCAGLVAGMVVIVWLGVFSRYFVDLGITWNEELARYVMIWAALLAVPAGIYRREHIGLDMLVRMLPPRAASTLRVTLDLIGIGFFLFLFVFGLSMAANGANQYATIFRMTMVVPLASVPTCAALSVVQLLLTMVRDAGESGRLAPGAKVEVS